ncbi:MAG: hypothetical protein WAM04_01395 [Candidatus Sulfotelmatobacter sp.]
MLERLKFARRLRKASAAAARVAPLVASSLFPVSSPGGGFDPRLKSDTFVVGYIYGVTMAFGGDRDRLDKGFLVQQVFEQLFPRQGDAITAYCNAKALEKNSDFMQATRVGFSETVEMVTSEGAKTLTSLLSHVCEHYMDSGETGG